MIDTLLYNLPKVQDNDILNQLNVTPQNYCVVTIHRPSNVDDKAQLSKLIRMIVKLQQRTRVVCPLHPRTMKNIEKFGLLEQTKSAKNLTFIKPLSYHPMLKLNKESSLVLTDSGGMQEETTVLGVPCITIRNNTERPVTFKIGTNEIVTTDVELILDTANKVLDGNKKSWSTPQHWDGLASKRIVNALENIMEA